jgi:hypothetical protein
MWVYTWHMSLLQVEAGHSPLTACDAVSLTPLQEQLTQQFETFCACARRAWIGWSSTSSRYVCWRGFAPARSLLLPCALPSTAQWLAAPLEPCNDDVCGTVGCCPGQHWHGRDV